MNYTYTKKTKQSEISLESLQKVWNEEEIVPIKFMPTGEISYVTPKIADVIRKYNGGKVKKGHLIQKRINAKNPDDFYKYYCTCRGIPKYVGSEWKWECSKCKASNYEKK